MQRVTRSAVIDAPIERVWEVLRDFNSHDRWHPAVAESHVENGEAPDQVGCVRNFRLRDGAHIREQLIALSDSEHVSTYCILDATVPLQRYVATLQLKPVTDGNRTFWHWQSTFDTPPGREAELADMVGRGVYEAGFEALRRHLRQLLVRSLERRGGHGLGARCLGREEAGENLGAPLDGDAGFRRAHLHGAQRENFYLRVRDGEHGRSQARRVFADAYF